jgi:hypothetical protein
MYIHEDELPADVPQEDYDKWFAQSWLSDGDIGVRVGPPYPFQATQVAVESADAGEIERLKALVYVPKICPDDEDLTYRDYAENLLRRFTTARADAIRESRDAVTGALRTIKENFIPVNTVMEVSVAALESLTKKEGDDGPTKV